MRVKVSFLSILTICLLLVQAQAQDPKTFVASEIEIAGHENALSEMALSTEEWLAGRMKQQDLLNTLRRAEKSLVLCKHLPKNLASKVHAAEFEMLQETKRFAQTQAPDSDGQRTLFKNLGKHYEVRSKALLSWRMDQNSALSQKLKTTKYLGWEAQWLPIWLEEASLTRRLQLGLLTLEKSEDDKNREILKSLLRLRLKGDKVQVPAEFQGLQTLAQERLTILARTAEQLIRMEKRKSRGALTRVRRLSKKLTQLTQQFQKERLLRLKRL